jgi:hypothetical protein
VLRDAVDDAVAGAGRPSKRSDGSLPPHVMVYLVMAPGFSWPVHGGSATARVSQPRSRSTLISSPVSGAAMTYPGGMRLTAVQS